MLFDNRIWIEFPSNFRSTRSRLSNITRRTVHKLLLRWTKIPRFFCRHRNQMSRLPIFLPSNRRYCHHSNNYWNISSFTLISIAWHYCDIDGRQATFLCPNGTQFSQAVFVCDWWFNVRCDLSPHLYEINARLYQKPKVNPTQPHRVITKDLIDSIFN